jgi:hypothetical protein
LEVIQSYIDGRNVDMVSEKVWDAYLLSLSKEKADLLRKMRTGLSPSSEVPNEATPETGETTGSDSGPSQDTISDLATAKSAS